MRSVKSNQLYGGEGVKRAFLCLVGPAAKIWCTRRSGKGCTALATDAKQILVPKRFATSVTTIGVTSVPATRKSISARLCFTVFNNVRNRHKKNKPAGYYERDQSDSESEKPVHRRIPRTYKKIRQRVHWKCSKCSGVFQYGSKLCDSCGSRREETGIRDPYVSPIPLMA